VVVNQLFDGIAAIWRTVLARLSNARRIMAWFAASNELPPTHGVVVPFLKNDTTGTEHIGPEDTFDGDYGRLLDAVLGQWVASPTGFDPWLALK
jgi:hypothetical protein